MKQVAYLFTFCAAVVTAQGPHRPVCQYEKDFDFPGHDIKAVSGVADTACCHECDTTSNCTAWTWSDHSGGTCWLKDGRDKIVVSKGMISAVLTNWYQPTCQVTQAADFEGNDLARVDGKSVNDCCEACKNYTGCRAYSYNSFLGGSCWLKSQRGKVVYKPGVQSAEAYPVLNNPVCSIREDVDFPGNDLANATSANPDLCCKICASYPHCRAYSWTNFNGGTCWLKDVVGKIVDKKGVQSGQASANPTDPYGMCTVEVGWDYQGGDIKSEPAPDPNLCCEVCYNRPGCKVYTWSDFDGGTCWLKSGIVNRVANAKTTSGKADPGLGNPHLL